MNTEKLNALKEQAYKTAVEHGFHEDVKPVTFYFGLVMSEAGEAINADRKGLHADTQAFEEGVINGLSFVEKLSFEENFRLHIKDTVEDEIASMVIRLFDFAGLKEYVLHLSATSCPYVRGEYLAADLFCLMAFLYDVHREADFEVRINSLINVLANSFGMLTGSDKDLWWFVKNKMRFNEQRPMLNGKKY